VRLFVALRTVRGGMARAPTGLRARSDAAFTVPRARSHGPRQRCHSNVCLDGARLRGCLLRLPAEVCLHTRAGWRRAALAMSAAA
jgi:hypothetical protein